MTTVTQKLKPNSSRLQGYDYASNGAYFVTITTKEKICYFGSLALTNDQYEFKRTEIGRKAVEFWEEIPQHYPFVVLDDYVVMPNHVHGILIFDLPNKEKPEPNRFGPQSGNLPAVIRGYKGSVKRFANKNQIEFEWLTDYYEHIIRNEADLNRIKEYIRDNPDRWLRGK